MARQSMPLARGQPQAQEATAVREHAASVSALASNGPAKSYRFILALAIWIVMGSMSLPTVAAQVGVTEFGCSPSSFTVKFNFSLTDQNIANMDGVNETSFFVTNLNFGSNSTDETPVGVSMVSVIESGLDSLTLVRESIPGPFLDGDTFVYTSITSMGSENITQLPGSISFTFNAENAAGDPLTANAAIRYTNANTFPVVEVGDNVGWAVFVSISWCLGIGCTCGK